VKDMIIVNPDILEMGLKVVMLDHLDQVLTLLMKTILQNRRSLKKMVIVKVLNIEKDQRIHHPGQDQTHPLIIQVTESTVTKRRSIKKRNPKKLKKWTLVIAMLSNLLNIKFYQLQMLL